MSFDSVSGRKPMRFSADQVELARELYDRNVPLDGIARELGCGRTRLWCLIREQGWPQRYNITRTSPDDLIRDLWGRKKPYDIAVRLGWPSAKVKARAASLGLDPIKPSKHGHDGKYSQPSYPDRPKGYSKQEVAWAKSNPDNREAGLMLLHHSEWQRWQQEQTEIIKVGKMRGMR